MGEEDRKTTQWVAETMPRQRGRRRAVAGEQGPTTRLHEVVARGGDEDGQRWRSEAARGGREDGGKRGERRGQRSVRGKLGLRARGGERRVREGEREREGKGGG